MSKREIIDRIVGMNRTAKADFLADFEEDDLLAYLHQLKEVERTHRQKHEKELMLV